MPLSFSVAEGGFVQSKGSSVEFRVQGPIENPDLETVSAPAYSSAGFSITTAIISILDGQVGSFKVEVRSSDIDGTNVVTHISETVTLTGAGIQGQALTVDVAAVGASKTLKLYLQYLSGDITSDISITLE